MWLKDINWIYAMKFDAHHLVSDVYSKVIRSIHIIQIR